MLSTAQLGSLTTAQLSGLDAAQLNGLDASVLNALNAASLSTSQIAGLTAPTLSVLSTAQFESFTPDQIGALTTEQLGSLSTAQMQEMTTGQIDGPDLDAAVGPVHRHAFGVQHDAGRCSDDRAAARTKLRPTECAGADARVDSFRRCGKRADVFEDFVCGFCPDEGLGVTVVTGDVASDCVFRFGDGIADDAPGALLPLERQKHSRSRITASATFSVQCSCFVLFQITPSIRLAAFDPLPLASGKRAGTSR